jgi:putative inorganic carbon (hco3(-)) transporter
VLALLLALIASGILGAERFELIVGLMAVASIIYLSWIADPAWPISAGVAASVFSAQWGELGFPVGLDRVLIATGLASVAVRSWRSGDRALLRIGLPHVLLALAVVWAFGSAIVVGTIHDPEAVYGLFDTIGLVPLLLFVASPVIYRTARQRAIFLGTMVGLGAYLGLTALFETVGLDALVWPRYILDPDVGLHFGRARGPFAQAVGNGIALFVCGVMAVIAVARWRRRATRLFAGATALLCLGGLLFTLTRSIWLASAVAALVVLVGAPPLRRFAVPAIGVAVVLVVAALALIPGLSDAAESRRSNQLPIWDRYNLNVAALNMIEERPLLGFGWATFPTESITYFRQGDEYPMRGAGSLAHNTFLSNSVELGLIGTALWLGALLLALAEVIRRRGPPDAFHWRVAFVAATVQFLVVAGFVLLSYPFPNRMVWILAGIALAAIADPASRRDDRAAAPATGRG